MSETIISKRCSSCKKTKTSLEFYKDRSKKDGLSSQCKSCEKTSRIRYRQTKKGKAARKRYHQSKKGKATDKRYQQSEKGKAASHKATQKYQKTEKGKAIHQLGVKRFLARHPNHLKAKNAVSQAIRDGKLARPKTRLCHYCPKPAQQYHHWHGYEKEHWLDVVPVCIDCHVKEQKPQPHREIA